MTIAGPSGSQSRASVRLWPIHLVSTRNPQAASGRRRRKERSRKEREGSKPANKSPSHSQWGGDRETFGPSLVLLTLGPLLLDGGPAHGCRLW